MQNNFILFWREGLKLAHWHQNTVIILLIPKQLKLRSFDLTKSTVEACTPRWAHKFFDNSTSETLPSSVLAQKQPRAAYHETIGGLR